ncbi:hypothetical protein D3C71_1351420 [compost metagenome]
MSFNSRKEKESLTVNPFVPSSSWSYPVMTKSPGPNVHCAEAEKPMQNIMHKGSNTLNSNVLVNVFIESVLIVKIIPYKLFYEQRYVFSHCDEGPCISKLISSLKDASTVSSGKSWCLTTSLLNPLCR